MKAQEEADSDIEHSFKNSATLELKIPERKKDDEVTREKPSSKNPYEYTIVAADETLEEDAKWTSITSETVLITKEKAHAHIDARIPCKTAVIGKCCCCDLSKVKGLALNFYPFVVTLNLVFLLVIDS